ncbi:hypothetical protein [Methylotenera sp.]|uniref:hypothetical protein n=1 Tax=Methylotenera sp. TaxID=2051956 RepID=UPI002732264C|nr:hypothetical protein [Methylotenera sp.]MDP2070263.1 hypothetical protein [Methylotenera sp.]MDP3007433.1 hypothetical protein [Methylotenera sp.]MDP3309201.1 hypothetical protein [Methylotenera sp.]
MQSKLHINQEISMNYKLKPLAMAILTSFLLSGCSTLSASNLHIYTPEEQAGMTPDGAIPTMITPSELREHFKNAGKVTKPTGHVSYCNAGLLSQSARSEALKTIDGACGGKGQYTIVRAVPMLDAVNTAVGTSCTRSEMIIFRCYGAQPKQ